MQALEIYAEDITRYEVLTREQEQAADVETLVNANLRLVWKIAKGYEGRGLSLADLISAGNTGLIIAARKYDPDVGKFSTYAPWWIKQKIMQDIEHQNIVRYPQNVIRNARTLMKNDYDREALAEATEKAYHLAQKAFLPNVSLSQPIDPTKRDGAKRQDAIRDDAPSPLDDTMETERAEFVQYCLSRLTKREADIMRRYFGIGCETETMESIGASFGISKERVRQLINRAKRKLNHLKREGVAWIS